MESSRITVPFLTGDPGFEAEKLWASEESLRVLMNSNPEAVFILDTEGNFIAANEKTASRFSIPLNQLIGTNVYSYLNPELAKNRKEKVNTVIATGKPLRFEDTRNNRYFDNYLHPVLDSEGKVIRIAVWVIDFTERKLAVDAYQASEEKFRQLAENIPDIFWIREGDELLYVSPAYETICGKTRESFYQNPDAFIAAIHPDDLGKVLESLTSKKYTEEGLFEEEFRIIRPDNTIRWVCSKTFPVIEEGKLIRTVGISEDISLRKEYEESIRNALLREKELNDLKSRFISMVSHEFRTPLGLILSSAELLQNYGHRWDETRRNEQFDRIKKAVNNLTVLLRDILTLNEEEAGKMKIISSEINVNSFFKEIIEEAEAELKFPAPVIHFSSEADGIVNSDKKLLRQIFLNLLTNAIKFTPPGKNIYVTILQEQPDYDNNLRYIFEIKDEGIGIPEQDAANIFEPFIRSGNAADIKGSGLGLSIVKYAIDMLNGSITVNSRLNEGSIFRVDLHFPVSPEECYGKDSGY